MEQWVEMCSIVSLPQWLSKKFVWIQWLVSCNYQSIICALDDVMHRCIFGISGSKLGSCKFCSCRNEAKQTKSIAGKTTAVGAKETLIKNDKTPADAKTPGEAPSKDVKPRDANHVETSKDEKPSGEMKKEEREKKSSERKSSEKRLSSDRQDRNRDRNRDRGWYMCHKIIKLHTCCLFCA